MGGEGPRAVGLRGETVGVSPVGGEGPRAVSLRGETVGASPMGGEGPRAVGLRGETVGASPVGGEGPSTSTVFRSALVRWSVPLSRTLTCQVSIHVCSASSEEFISLSNLCRLYK